MGVKLTDLLIKKEISVGELSKKTIAVDAPLWLYQFLSSIRQMDGSLLTDSHGRVTSHLMGLFTRSTSLMQQGISLVYVFDGVAPELKSKECQRRKELKIEAGLKYEQAKKRDDIEEMRKYAKSTTSLNQEMIAEAKKLLDALGVEHLDAPSEGEAEAAHLVKSGVAFAVASQDADCLLFGASRLVRNLSISGRKKLPGKLAYREILPESVLLEENLAHLGIDRRQLIALGMLVGTDFNPGGIKGIGPKNALKMVKAHGKQFDVLFKEARWEEHFDVSWEEVFGIIENMPVMDWKIPEQKEADREKIYALLCDAHDFSHERVENAIERLDKQHRANAQKGLDGWF